MFLFLIILVTDQFYFHYHILFLKIFEKANFGLFDYHDWKLFLILNFQNLFSIIRTKQTPQIELLRWFRDYLHKVLTKGYPFFIIYMCMWWGIYSFSGDTWQKVSTFSVLVWISLFLHPAMTPICQILITRVKPSSFWQKVTLDLSL